VASPLERIRQSRGLSQVQVAALAGVSVQTVHRIEGTGLAGLQLGTLIRVADALGVAPVELVPGLAGSRRRPAQGRGGEADRRG
jgi:transcriptional regulator with XRE-family HTH domain